MIRLLAFLVLFATVADAQSYLQFRRGNTSALPTGQVGEPLFTRDSLDVYMGSDSGNVLVGGRSVVYGKATFAKDAGSTDAYAITLAPAPTKYWNGMRLSFMANTANTGSATLNVNSLGAKTIYKGGLASDTLVTGDISQYDRVTVLFADSAFFLQSRSKNLDSDSLYTSGGISVSGNATFGNNVTVNGVLAVIDSIRTEANLWVDGNTNIVGTLTVGGVAVRSGTSRYIPVPEIGAGTTGTAWVSTAYNINFYPFEVSQTFTPDSVVWYLLSSNAATDSFRVGIYSLAGAVQCTTALETHGSTSSNIRLAQAFTSSPTLSPGTYILAWQHNTTSPPSADIINTVGFFRAAEIKRWAGTVAASGGQSFPATLSGAAAYQAAAQAPVVFLIGE